MLFRAPESLREIIKILIKVLYFIRSRNESGDLIPKLKLDATVTVWIDTRWPQRFRLSKNVTSTDFEDNGVVATNFFELYEGGEYEFDVTNSTSFKSIISHTKMKDLRRDYVKPIWIALIIVSGLKILQVLIWKYIGRDSAILMENGRLKSLDIFRGFCVTGGNFKMVKNKIFISNFNV